MERSVNDQTEKAIPQSNVAGNPRRRSKGAERIAEEGVAGAKNIGMFAAESIPGVGEAMAVKRTSDALDEGDYVGAGIEATAGTLGMVPIIGDAASKGLRQVAKSVRKGYNPEDPASRVFHLTKKDYDVADVVGSGINADIGFHVGTAAQATARGSTNIKYDKELAEEMVKGERILPLVLKENLKPARIPDVSSFKEPMRWIGDMSVAKSDRQRRKFLLGDPSDAALLKKAPRVTVGGDTYFMLPDVMRIGMDEKLWKDIILQAHRAKRIGLDTVTNQADRVEWFNTLKQTANKHGYDSFVYRNEYEGTATENIDALVEQIQRAQRGEIDSNEIDLSSRFSDSYMLLEPDQAKGLFGGMTEGDPRYMKNQGGLMLQKGGATVMDRQMDMFQSGGFTVTEEDGGTRATQGNMTQTEAALMQKERESTKGLDTSESMDAAMQGLDKSIAARKRFDEMNKQLAMGAISDLSLEEKEAFVAEYKNLKEKHSFAEGGMLKEGGLEDDGGTVDPVSGNEVPPGSSKEEVRDDIPAQLSEGEFVFPADVVRYIGLEKLMMMRQQAKMGLKMMEEMGQMGNSDEATIPDDLPFGMMDLIIVDSEDEEEYNNKKEKAEGGLAMQEGGVVTPQDAGIFYQPSQFAGEANRPGVATPAPDAASRQFVQQPQQSATPTVRYEQPKTTFGEFLTPPQGGPQTITIVNKETGEERMITFIPGATEIPEGFVRKEDYVPKEIVPETETTRVETATVAPETGGDDEARQRREEEMYGPGGGRVGVRGKIYGVSFDMPEGFMPGMATAFGTSLGLATGKPLPENVTVNFKRGETEFAVTGTEYNKFKSIAENQGYNSDAAENALDEMRENALSKKAEKEAAEAEAARQAKLAAIEAAKAAATKAARKKAEEERRKQEQIEQQRLRELSETNINRLYGDSADRDDRQQQRAERQREADKFTREAVSDVAGRIASGRGFGEGGLASKPKPKTKKKMKRGGLASKK
jgi:hypothetical protein